MAAALLTGLLQAAAPSGAYGSTSPAVTSCPTTTTLSKTALPSSTAQRITEPERVSGMAAAGGRFAVLSNEDNRVTVYAADGAQIIRFQVPQSDADKGQIALDVDGNVYLVRYPVGLVKYDLRGREVWSRAAGAGSSVFTYGAGNGAGVGLVSFTSANSTLFGLDGTARGSAEVWGTSFTLSADGGVVAGQDGRYVRSYDSTLTSRSVVGDSARQGDPDPDGAPMHFTGLGSSVRLPDGRLLVGDSERGIMVLSPDGFVTGVMPAGRLDAVGMVESAAIGLLGDQVYVSTGYRWSRGQFVSRLPLAEVLSWATGAQPQDSPRLGLGAGIVSPYAGGYVPAGKPAEIRLRFDPSWKDRSAELSVCYQIRGSNDLRNGSPGVLGSLPVSTLTFSPDGDLLPLGTLPAGPYQIDASLLKRGEPMARTRMHLAVSAPGQRLDLATLPPGGDAGGPGPARGVALADVLGTGLHRAQLDWNVLLRNGRTAPVDVSSYLAPFAAAAAQAQTRGVTFEVQVGQGGIEKELVADGSWGRRVGEVVAQLKGSVRVWEAWNEPNNTYGSPADYVTQVLAPFYRAVKAEDPAATVVGGSTLNVSLDWWRGLVAAGGLQYLDVAGVHPYTAHNVSWEEDGTVEQLRQLRALLVKAGQPVPIWNTESAWWSNGSGSFLAQGDSSARALLWSRALGIDKWAYFIPEGTWGNDGVDFSAIRLGGAVKPAALALMTTSSELRGRPYLGEVAVPAPSAFALRFGPPVNDPGAGELLVAWSEGLQQDVVVQGTAGVLRVTDVYGDARKRSFTGAETVALDSAPRFFSSTGGQLGLRPVQNYGANLTAGGTARSSSARTGAPASGVLDGSAASWWQSDVGDAAPSLTVTMRASTVDRILVGTHSLTGVLPGVRDFDVQVRSGPDRAWSTVAEVRDVFHRRQRLVSFPPTTVGEIRVVVRAINWSGYNDGDKPDFWPTDQASLTDPRSDWYGPAVLSDVSAYAPAGTATAPPAPTSPVVTLVSPLRATLGALGQHSVTVTNLTAAADRRPLTIAFDGGGPAQTVLSVSTPPSVAWTCVLSDVAVCTWSGGLDPGAGTPTMSVQSRFTTTPTSSAQSVVRVSTDGRVVAEATSRTELG